MSTPFKVNLNSMKHSALKGYTLIEILITITIISVIFSVGYASFREFSLRQQLSGVSKLLISDLRLIQQKSSTGEKPAGTTCNALNGYAFVLVSNTVYDLRANCTNNSDITVKTTVLPDGITMAVSTNSTLFKVLGQGTDLAGSNTLTLTQTATGNMVTVTIGVGGDIQ